MLTIETRQQLHISSTSYREMHDVPIRVPFSLTPEREEIPSQVLYSLHIFQKIDKESPYE